MVIKNNNPLSCFTHFEIDRLCDFKNPGDDDCYTEPVTDDEELENAVSEPYYGVFGRLAAGGRDSIRDFKTLHEAETWLNNFNGKTPDVDDSAGSLIDLIMSSRLAPDKLWGEFGVRGTGLRFREDGLIEVHKVVGYLAGVCAFNKAIGCRLARHFLDRLDYLSTYGGLTVSNDVEVPSHLVTMTGDSQFGCFGLQWLRLKEKPDDQTPVIRKLEKHNKVFEYAAWMWGGMVFNNIDPGTVVLRAGDNPWSIHT